MNYCELCGRPAMKSPHHLLTRGAYGNDRACVEENEIWLCWVHHSQAHSLGIKSFIGKYALEDRLKEAERVIWKSKE